MKLLQTAAHLVPVPLLKDALGLAIKVIEVCEVSTSDRQEFRISNNKLY